MERRRFARATRRDAARGATASTSRSRPDTGDAKNRASSLRISVAANTMPWFLARHLTVQDRPAKTNGSPTTNVTSCPTPGTRQLGPASTVRPMEPEPSLVQGQSEDPREGGGFAEARRDPVGRRDLDRYVPSGIGIFPNPMPDGAMKPGSETPACSWCQVAAGVFNPSL